MRSDLKAAVGQLPREQIEHHLVALRTGALEGRLELNGTHLSFTERETLVSAVTGLEIKIGRLEQMRDGPAKPDVVTSVRLYDAAARDQS